MTAVVLIGGGAVASIGPSTVRYSLIGCAPMDWNATESARQIPWGHSATLSHFAIALTVNDIPALSAAAVRINGATGTQIILIPASTSGIFEDVTNTDPVVQGDLVNALIFTGAGGSFLTIGSTRIASSAASKTISVYASINTGAMNVAGSTRYIMPVGQGANTATEANATVRASIAGTLKNRSAIVTANTRVDDTEVRSRINAAFGTVSIIIPAGTTGTFEDLTNEDVLAEGDEWCLSGTLGAGAGSISITRSHSELETEDGSAQLYAFNSGVVIVNAGATKYSHFGGSTINTTNEAAAQQAIGIENTYRRLQCKITANSITATSTVTARNNAGDVTQQLLVPASTTGIFEDVTNEDTYLSTDLASIEITGGATGTSFRFTWMSIVQKAEPIVVDLPIVSLLLEGRVPTVLTVDFKPGLKALKLPRRLIAELQKVLLPTETLRLRAENPSVYVTESQQVGLFETRAVKINPFAPQIAVEYNKEALQADEDLLILLTDLL